MVTAKDTLTRAAAGLAAVALVTLGLWGLAAPATADVPAEPSGPFTAALCEGQTIFDPQDADGDVADLTSVFGGRLAHFNEGRVVPLYDAFGMNELNGYPPVCGVRYVEGIGAVSEWMFCTDYFSHVCSGVNADGDSVDIDGNPLDGMDRLEGANPKLSADEEKIIAYLIQHGSPTYEGVGYFDFPGADSAVVDEGSYQRAALQVLIWCVSDPVAAGATDTEAERAATCAANMDDDAQAAILAQVPEDPFIDVSGPEAPLDADETAEFVIDTNVVTSPVLLDFTGDPAELFVVSGPAVLDGTTVQISSDDSEVTIVLGYTSSIEEEVTLRASATPTSTSHIGWNQSPTIAEDGEPCQVFAAFYASEQVVLDGVASATFLADDADGDADATDGDIDVTDGDADATDADATDADADATDADATDADATDADATDADATDAGSTDGGASGAVKDGLAPTGGEPVAPVVLAVAAAAILLGVILTVRARRNRARTDEDTERE